MSDQLCNHLHVSLASKHHSMSELDKIIKKSVRGDHKSFKKIYDLFSKELYMICYRYMGSREDAEEVLQEGFIKLYRDLRQYDRDKGAFKPWIKRVFINTSLEHLRKKKLIKVELNGYHAVDNFEDEIFDQLSVLDIVKLIGLLPAGYRTVLNLYILEGYTHQEISTQLEISESTSKSQLYKAKAKLRNLLITNYPEYTKSYVRGATAS